jgi:hypothetical protein
MAFDLKQLDIVSKAEEGSWCEIKHPVSGDVTGARLRLAGMDSKRYKDAQRRIAETRLNRKSTGKINLEEIESEGLTVLVECTLEWDGMVLDGVPVPFERSAIRRIYEGFPTVREQAEQHIADRANYLRD